MNWARSYTYLFGLSGSFWRRPGRKYPAPLALRSQGTTKYRIQKGGARSWRLADILFEQPIAEKSDAKHHCWAYHLAGFLCVHHMLLMGSDTQEARVLLGKPRSASCGGFGLGQTPFDARRALGGSQIPSQTTAQAAKAKRPMSLTERFWSLNPLISAGCVDMVHMSRNILPSLK